MYIDNPYESILQAIQLNFGRCVTVIETLEELKEEFQKSNIKNEELQKSNIKNEAGLKRVQYFIDYLILRHSRRELNYPNAEIQHALLACLELHSELELIK